MQMNKVYIKDLFLELQGQMQVILRNQKNFNHPVTKGDYTEMNWLDWLRKYLPKRYSIDKAFVVDHLGNLSEQIDLVIYDSQYSPFIFNQNGIKYITAESVYAVFEIKPELNKEYVEYAGEKIASVRKLKRSTAPIVYSTGIQKPKKLFKILGGILTTKSGWKTPFDNNLKKILSSLNVNEQLDLICCIEESAYQVQYSKNKISLNKNKNDEILIYTFLKLLSMLQQLGTVPAIDINLYAKTIYSK
jgi:hypothetical protein